MPHTSPMNWLFFSAFLSITVALLTVISVNYSFNNSKKNITLNSTSLSWKW